MSIAELRVVNGFDPHVQTVARHEAAHAAAAHLLGWEVTDVEIRPDGTGDCHFVAPDTLSRVDWLEQYAVISLAAPAYRRDDGDGNDLLEARDTARKLAGLQQLPVDWLLGRLRKRAGELARSREFDWIACYVADMLLNRGRLSAGELEPLFQAARRDCADRRLREPVS